MLALAQLAGSWLSIANNQQAAEATKLTEAEAKAKILLSEKTSVADWERIMAEGTQSSIKDEVVTFAVLTPCLPASSPVWKTRSKTVSSGFQSCRSGIHGSSLPYALRR